MHVLKNILIPIVTVIGLEFGSVIAFAIVTETIFAWPGMGKLLIDSINVLDRPVIVAYLLIIVVMFVLINLRRRCALHGARSARARAGGARMSTAAAAAPRRELFASFARSRLALAALIVLALIIVVRRLRAAGLAAESVRPGRARHHGREACRRARRAPRARLLCSARDEQGRDMLSAIFYGLRISLGVGVISTVLALALGMAIGLAAGYAGGWVDALIMRIVDLQLSFPSILIALVLLAVLGQGVDKIVIALVTVQWAYYARTVRGAALVEKRKEYVDAALCLALQPLAHRLPAHPAELPAAADRRRDSAGRARDCARSDAFVPRSGHADHVAVARPAHRQRLHPPAVRAATGSASTRDVALLLTIVAINLVGDHLRDVLNPRL